MGLGFQGLEEGCSATGAGAGSGWRGSCTRVRGLRGIFRRGGRLFPRMTARLPSTAAAADPLPKIPHDHTQYNGGGDTNCNDDDGG